MGTITPVPSTTTAQLIAVIGSIAVWPAALILLVVAALAFIPANQRVDGLHALADLVRAARGRGNRGPTPSGGADDVQVPNEGSRNQVITASEGDRSVSEPENGWPRYSDAAVERRMSVG